ncbi:MAG TPA: PDZ domain-containing protein [Planctomycetaceae bacterium]|nr:PDZ domain-containing protein [Planctomycetaceae bacterium]
MQRRFQKTLLTALMVTGIAFPTFTRQAQAQSKRYLLGAYMNTKVLEDQTLGDDGRGRGTAPSRNYVVEVTGLLAGGPAERAGLKVGDYIVQINNSQVHDAKQAIRAITTSQGTLKLKLMLKDGYEDKRLSDKRFTRDKETSYIVTTIKL